jgi:hypothetical protein
MNKSRKMLDSLKKTKKTRKAKREKTRSVTKFKKDTPNKTTVFFNEKEIGYVEQNLQDKWELKPAFAPLAEDEYIIKSKFDGPIAAGREMVKLYERYRAILDANVGNMDYYKPYS